MKKLLLLGSAVPTKLGMLAAQHAHTSDQTFTTSCGMAGNEMTSGALGSEVACRALNIQGMCINEPRPDAHILLHTGGVPTLTKPGWEGARGPTLLRWSSICTPAVMTENYIV